MIPAADESDLAADEADALNRRLMMNLMKALEPQFGETVDDARLHRGRGPPAWRNSMSLSKSCLEISNIVIVTAMPVCMPYAVRRTQCNFAMRKLSLCHCALCSECSV